MGDIFLSGQNKCHITGVKKSYFCHTFHLRPKKVFWWVVGGWRVAGGGGKVTLVSVCVHFLKLLDTQTQKWTQSLTINESKVLVYHINFHRQNLDSISKHRCCRLRTGILTTSFLLSMTEILTLMSHGELFRLI